MSWEISYIIKTAKELEEINRFQERELEKRDYSDYPILVEITKNNIRTNQTLINLGKTIKFATNDFILKCLENFVKGKKKENILFKEAGKKYPEMKTLSKEQIAKNNILIQGYSIIIDFLKETNKGD